MTGASRRSRGVQCRLVSSATAGRVKVFKSTARGADLILGIMSRWNREGVLTTAQDGILIHDRGALETLARS